MLVKKTVVSRSPIIIGDEKSTQVVKHYASVGDSTNFASIFVSWFAENFVASYNPDDSQSSPTELTGVDYE